MKAVGSVLSDLPWGEVYYSVDGRCVMRLAKTYGNRQDVFERLMEKLAGYAKSMEMYPTNLKFFVN